MSFYWLYRLYLLYLFVFVHPYTYTKASCWSRVRRLVSSGAELTATVLAWKLRDDVMVYPIVPTPPTSFIVSSVCHPPYFILFLFFCDPYTLFPVWKQIYLYKKQLIIILFLPLFLQKWKKKKQSAARTNIAVLTEVVLTSGESVMAIRTAGIAGTNSTAVSTIFCIVVVLSVSFSLFLLLFPHPAGSTPTPLHHPVGGWWMKPSCSSPLSNREDLCRAVHESHSFFSYLLFPLIPRPIPI